MTKFGMIEKNSGYTFFFGIDDIHHIYFLSAIDFLDEDDVLAYGFEPNTILMIIVMNDGIIHHYDSTKYQIYFE